MHCLQVAITTSERESWGYTIMRSTLRIIHPAQERLVTPVGSTSYTPNSGVHVGFFFTSHNFRPYPWSLESLTLLQMPLQRQYFLLSCLKTLSVGPAGVWTRALPIELTRRRWKIPRYYDCLLLLITLSQLIDDLLDFKNTWHFEESPINLCSQFKLLGSGKIQVFNYSVLRMKMINN